MALIELTSVMSKVMSLELGLLGRGGIPRKEYGTELLYAVRYIPEAPARIEEDRLLSPFTVAGIQNEGKLYLSVA